MAHRTIQGQLNSSGMRFAIVASRFNDFVTSRLLSGALDALERTGTAEADVTVVRVPGSFEIPLAAKKLVQTKKYDAIICLGTLIRGETPHFDYIASEVARGIARLEPLRLFLWGWLQQLVNHKSYASVTQLRRSIERAWDQLDPNMVESACVHEFKKRLNLVIRHNGGLIDHLL